ncbi:cilia- and flagella-associated protein 107 [Conger conger]|uniref:cilia- and flagella-associated protein 107 n=1 Tax=Conger conger TaxID=82655 RepID=UPI002A5A8D24|nr:cilia- and flagella-associated protein 107 [Conger conger]
MAMDEKWAKPGWRIEQKYGDKVLIGNWAEERLQFTRDCRTSTSTHCADYLPQRDHRPDVFVRREALRRAEGLPTRLLLDHHNLPRSHYLVSHYDETYGRQSASALSTCRSWHRDKLAWVPERSDHPAKAPPTNFGLVEWQRAHSGKQAEGGGHMLSVYMSAFPRHPASAFCPPHSARTPRTLSSHLHPANNVNKDLGLRHSALLQVPDRPARPLPPVSAPPSQTRTRCPSLCAV